MDSGSHDPHPSCLHAAHSHGPPAGHCGTYTKLLKAPTASRNGFLSSQTTYSILVVSFSFLQDKTIGKSILFHWKGSPFPIGYI